MVIRTKFELDAFHEHATRELAGTGEIRDVESLWQAWLQQQERLATITDIKRGRADVAAGRVQVLATADQEMLAVLGFISKRS